MTTTDLIGTTRAAIRLVEHMDRTGFAAYSITTHLGSISIHFAGADDTPSPLFVADITDLPVLEVCQFPMVPGAFAFTTVRSTWEDQDLTIFGAYDPPVDEAQVEALADDLADFVKPGEAVGSGLTRIVTASDTALRLVELGWTKGGAA